jgi:arylsulfatase A-like enzyme
MSDECSNFPISKADWYPYSRWLVVLVTLLHLPAVAEAGSDRPPNIVYIMSDELAYYELSHMGNPWIRTPTIDRLAAEGLRFTQALAGAPVCAPLRCSLMTGKHMGHASVRANDGGTPLRAEEPTIASMLKRRGYATGGFGKWGCGGRDSTGVPEQHGFDVFFGYYDQVHAHSYYPPYLIRNSQEVELPGNQGGRSGKTYSHYAIMDEALQFIRSNRDQPFFCYLPITPPHGMYDIPEDDPAWDLYDDAEWVKDPTIPQDVKNYAAMVSMVDRNVQQVLDLLRELGLEENTILFFTGDNGGQDRFRSDAHPRGFFGPNVDPKTNVAFRGGKGNLYEGGLRIPFIVRWPGKIPEGRVSDLIFYQPDIMPTLAELTGADAPNDLDGISILPEILGSEVTGRSQSQHPYLYWEYVRQVAVRMDMWKAVRPKPDAPWELYDLNSDVSEANDVSAAHPDVLDQMKTYAAEAHQPVRPGVFSDRTRHEKDRWAKWGTSRNAQRNPSRKMHRIEDPDLVPVANMKVVRFSSENSANNRRAIYAVDGDPGTVWHSQFTGRLASHPHELCIDLGGTFDVTGFRYLARQDSGWNGAFGKTLFFVSDSPDEFGEPVATVNFQKKRTAQAVDVAPPVKGRYVLVRVLSEVNERPWASAAEIGVTHRD